MADSIKIEVDVGPPNFSVPGLRLTDSINDNAVNICDVGLSASLRVVKDQGKPLKLSDR